MLKKFSYISCFLLGLILFTGSCSEMLHEPVTTTSESSTTLTETITNTPTNTPLPSVTSTHTLTPSQTPTQMDPVVFEAINVYGMPQEQAEKLAGLNVEFEVITKNVDGVLVKDAETGESAYYFDLQTEFLVAVDRWPLITNAENYADVVISKQEVLTDEFFAWTKYLVSNVGEGIGPNERLARPDGKMSRFTTLGEAEYLINFPGQLNKGVAYAKLSEEDLFYIIMVNSYRFNNREYPVVLLFQSSIYASSSNAKNYLQMIDDMKRSPVQVNSTTVVGEEDPFIQKVINFIGEEKIDEAMKKFEEGDPSLISQPGMVFLSFASLNQMNEN